MTLTEKVAYIKGLADGMELDESKKEVKLLLAVIDVLDEAAAAVAELDENLAAVEEEMDAISDDLADVEEVVFEDEDDDCGCGCGCHDDEDDEFNDEAHCPKCDELLQLHDEDFENGYVVCSACGEKLQFEICEDDCCC